jgi:hypothetical protein
MNLVFPLGRHRKVLVLYFSLLSISNALSAINFTEDDDGPAAKRIKIEEGHHAQQEGEDDVAAVHAAAIAAAAEHQAQQDAVAQAQLGVAHLDPSMAGVFTAEQLANFQQQAGMAVFTPEVLAAFQNQTGTAAAQAVGPDGQPLMQMPMMTADMAAAQGFAGFDPASLGLAGMPGISGMDMLQNLPPEQLQAIIQNQNLFQFGNSFSMGGAGESNATYKNWWDEKDEAELMQMVSDDKYRMEKLGIEELDWAKMESYFNRSANALRKKFWSLSKNQGMNPAAYGVTSPGSGGIEFDPSTAMATAAAAAAAAMASAQPIAVAPPSAHPRHRQERKNWSNEETAEMAKIVSDAAYRAGLGLQEGEEEVSWDRLADKFGCTMQTAKRKYRHLQDQATTNNGIVPEKKKREHYRKSVPYRWMIVSALSKIAGFEATAPQIFESIESDHELRGQLDIRIMPGTKHVPRWKIQIRKVLSADHIFINTGVKQKHETIWRLDPIALQEANADRQRQRAGVPPINLSQGGGGVDGSAGLPAAPALTGTGTEAMAALQLPMGVTSLTNEQTMAMLQQQQLMMSLPDAQQLQLMSLPEGTIIDPSAFAALIGGAGMDPQAMAEAMGAAANQQMQQLQEQGQQQLQQQQQQQEVITEGGEEQGQQQLQQEQHHVEERPVHQEADARGEEEEEEAAAAEAAANAAVAAGEAWAQQEQQAPPDDANKEAEGN